MPEQTPAALHAAFAEDGWTDAELRAYIDAIVATPDPRAHLGALEAAVLDPTLPADLHRDPRFYEVLAWYLDQKTASGANGQLSLAEVRDLLVNQGRAYLSQALDPAQATSRLQSWKMIQKLRLLEAEIVARAEAGEGAWYPYRPRQMAAIDQASDWNAANTVDSRAEFEARVLRGSEIQPVLVKFGLTYCAHCLLLEHLGAVPAVARRYAGALDVVKLWWNPHDPAMAEITAVAREQGVTSSPWFIVYRDGQPVRSGYGFPDENGEGLEALLAGIVA
jgi:hypothetical protein